MHETPVFSAAWTSRHSSSMDEAPPTSMAAYLPADIASAARARWEFQDVGIRTPSTPGSAISAAASEYAFGAGLPLLRRMPSIFSTRSRRTSQTAASSTPAKSFIAATRLSPRGPRPIMPRRTVFGALRRTVLAGFVFVSVFMIFSVVGIRSAGRTIVACRPPFVSMPG